MADRPNPDEVTVRVTLTGEITIPAFAARELIKGPHYTVSEMLLDQFMPGWNRRLKPDACRHVRDALTGVRSFDPDMTNTLR